MAMRDFALSRQSCRCRRMVIGRAAWFAQFSDGVAIETTSGWNSRDISSPEAGFGTQSNSDASQKSADHSQNKRHNQLWKYGSKWLHGWLHDAHAGQLSTRQIRIDCLVGESFSQRTPRQTTQSLRFA